MSDLLPINWPVRRNNIAQDAPGTIFSRGGRYAGIPSFRPRASSTARFSRFNVMGNFRTVEDGVDAAVPVDAKNAPTGTWKTAQTAVFHSVHTDQFFLLEEREHEEGCKCADLIVSTEGFTPLNCARKCVLSVVPKARVVRAEQPIRVVALSGKGDGLNASLLRPLSLITTA